MAEVSAVRSNVWCCVSALPPLPLSPPSPSPLPSDKRLSTTFDKFRVGNSSWDYSGDTRIARIHAETVLLHARFKDELELLGLNEQFGLFHSVQKLRYGETWEKAYYVTGNCIRKHLKRQEESGNGSGKYTYLEEIFKNYLLCLKHGSQFFYQTLPFIFENWFGLAAEVTEYERQFEKIRNSESGESQVGKMTLMNRRW